MPYKSILEFVMRISRSIILWVFPLILCLSPLYGAFSVINGELSDERFLPVYSPQEHFELSSQSFNNKQWEEALRHSLIINLNFPETPFYAEATYQAGVCYYFLSELDLSNRELNRYLTLPGCAKHFEEVFEYKYLIADKYRLGAKRHMFGYDRMPKWATGRGEALKLYDEIVASLPNRDLATKALYSKALLLRSRGDYRESIEALQMLIRRFPKHELSPESYVLISEIYLEQSQIEAQNPDLLALAELNTRRFKTMFPGEQRVAKAEHHLLGMKESFAGSVYETGRFYERKKKPNASYIYYADAIRRYPETYFATKCVGRLEKLGLMTEALKKQIEAHVPRMTMAQK